MTHVTCRLTAKNQDQLRNPTLGNRVWATFLPLPFYARHDTDRTVLSRLVWQGPTARQTHCASGLRRSASGGAVRPPDALRRRTHLSSGQFASPHQTRQNCRACQSTAAAATQARQAATPSRPTAHVVRHENVNTL